MPFSVVAGLVPAIHVGSAWPRPQGFADQAPTARGRPVRRVDVDGRDKPGHDGGGGRCHVTRFVQGPRPQCATFGNLASASRSSNAVVFLT